MGEQIIVGERRPLLVDGANPSADAVISTTDTAGAITIAAADANGVVVVTANAEEAGLDITVIEGAQSGTDAGIVIGPVPVPPAPLTVTLGSPL